MKNRSGKNGGLRSTPSADPQRAWVVVLGDAGRSPRMQYHALSLCKTVRYTKCMPADVIFYGDLLLL